MSGYSVKQSEGGALSATGHPRLSPLLMYIRWVCDGLTSCPLLPWSSSEAEARLHLVISINRNPTNSPTCRQSSSIHLSWRREAVAAATITTEDFFKRALNSIGKLHIFLPSFMKYRVSHNSHKIWITRHLCGNASPTKNTTQRNSSQFRVNKNERYTKEERVFIIEQYLKNNEGSAATVRVFLANGRPCLTFWKPTTNHSLKREI